MARATWMRGQRNAEQKPLPASTLGALGAWTDLFPEDVLL